MPATFSEPCICMLYLAIEVYFSSFHTYFYAIYLVACIFIFISVFCNAMRRLGLVILAFLFHWLVFVTSAMRTVSLVVSVGRLPSSLLVEES